jgi:putative ABC transport system permease protein
VYALCVLGIIAYILQTQLGYCFIVYGNNPLFFNYSLISGRFVFCAGIILAHACAGLSGYLVAQYNGFIDLGMGQGVTLLCISIIVLGKLFLSVRSKLLALVPMLGAISYFLLQRVLIKIGFDLKYFTLVQALLVLIIVVIGSFKKRAQNSVDTVDILGV